MSSAANHRKRSHRSKQKHYAAEAKQHYRNIGRKNAKFNSILAVLKRLFNMLHKRSREV